MFSAVIVPVLIFFHAPSSRLYLVETLLILVIDLAVRKLTTLTSHSTLELVPGTSLVKVTSPISTRRLAAFKASPGSHVYLNIPRASRGSAGRIFDFLSNPFTVASVDDDQGIITLVARTHKGPVTRMLSQFASSFYSSSSDRAKILLAIEGPYGAMGKHFRDLVEWGAARILIVAGGVGATFALPVYRALCEELPSVHLRLVWAVRSPEEAAWAFAGNRSILDDDDRVQLFLTEPDLAPDPAAGFEMEALLSEPGGHLPAADGRRRRRPDLKKLVDATFRLGIEERIAVLVCGPTKMASELRQFVRPWVMQDRCVAAQRDLWLVTMVQAF